MKSSVTKQHLTVAAATLTADERNQQDHAAGQVERARRVLDDEQQAAHQRIQEKFGHLGAEFVSELVADFDRSINKARGALEMGMSAANSHGVASGIVTPHAIRSVRTSATENGRKTALEKRRASAAEQIVREVRTAHAGLRTVEPWSEADSMLKAVNRLRKNQGLPPTNRDALRKQIERIDRKDKRRGLV